MPIHNWSRMQEGDFHHFHQRWISAITDALNGGVLPPEFMALSEQVTGRPIPDVVTLQTHNTQASAGGVGLAPAPAPSARVVQKLERINYARRKDRVVIRHGRGRVVAIIELVSPGNKDSRKYSAEFRRFPSPRRGRRSVARGASPWKKTGYDGISVVVARTVLRFPIRRPRGESGGGRSLQPLCYQGLTPLATDLRPLRGEDMILRSIQ